MRRAVLCRGDRGLAAGVAVALAVGTWAAEPAPQGYYRMKLVKVVDLHGFEKPMTALTVLVPTDWSFQGEVRIDPKNACTATLVQVSFRATSPDGRTAVELFPGAAWSWSDDPATRQLLERDRQAKARFGRKGCPVGPPLSAKDYLSRSLAARARPGARIVESEVDPQAAKALAGLVKQAEAQAAQVGLTMQLRADTARIRIEYDREGKPEEEWLTGVTIARGTWAPTLDARSGRMGQALSYSCGAQFLFGARAPKGQLEASDKLFRAVVGSVRVAPAWQARVQDAQLKIQAAELKGARDRSRIIARSQQDASRIVNEGFQRRQEAQERNSEEWSQVIRGVETYRNPSTGETVELSNRYGNAWSNGKNEYLLSESPNFNPNTVSRDSWTRLEPVPVGK